MLKLVKARWFEFLCSSHSSDGSVTAVTDKLTMHTQTPLQCGNQAGPTNPRQTLSPNKRLQPNPVPQLFSVTLQAEKEIENLDLDVTAMNPQCTAHTEQARSPLERSPAMSPQKWSAES